MSIRFKVLYGVVLCLILIGVFATYQQGKTGALFYDDLTNLSVLADIANVADAKRFVFEGSAGPLGRPLSLASFLPHAEKWPHSSVEAIIVNIVIHILNALLLLGIGYLLLWRSGLFKQRHAMIAALMAMALWICMPLLASTTLIVVQRMTGLASLLGLTGVLGYLLLSKVEAPESFSRLTLKISVLFGFTALAMFAKENAAVFPLYALVGQWLLLKDPREQGVTRKLEYAVLCTYLVVLVGYLVYKTPPELFAVNPQRGFSLFERLITQPVILWDYICLALIPDLNQYGPFHDDVQVVSNYGLSLIATACFIGLVTLGLYLKKTFPFLIFAVLWFFIGHLIESSVIMLEFYFEHRNYVAIYGLCLMIAAAVFLVSQRYRKILAMAFCAYVLLQFMVLAMLTNIWGKPAEAAEHWAKVKPQSSRAIMALSENYYRNLANPVYANTALDRGLVTCEGCLDVYMQALIYGCLGEEHEKITERYNRFLQVAGTGNFTPAMLDGVYPLREFVQQSACGTLGLEDVQKLLLAIERNPRFEGTANKIHLIYLQAVVAADQKHWEEALRHLEELGEIRTIFSAVTLKSQILQQRDGLEAAIIYLGEIQRDPNYIGDVDRAEWDGRMKEFVDDMKKQAEQKSVGKIDE